MSIFIKLLSVLLVLMPVSAIANEQVNKVNFLVSSGKNLDSDGVYQITFPTNSQIKNENVIINRIIKTRDPSYLDFSQDRQTIFALGGTKKSGASVFNYKEGQWQQVGHVAGLGRSPCHISYNQAQQLVVVAPYMSAFVNLLKFNPVTNQLDLLKQFKHQGQGSHPRQEMPHPHWADWSPLGEHLYGIDLGIDEVKHYFYDDAAQAWDIKTALKLQSEDGPRHLAFHRHQNIAFILNELSNTLVVAEYDIETGDMTVKQRLPTLKPGFTEHSQAAAIRISKDNRFVYVSNRGENTIAGFEILPDGTVKHIQSISTEGDWPRDFNLSDSQSYLLVANTRSDQVALFYRDFVSGLLKYSGHTVDINRPKFVQGWDH